MISQKKASFLFPNSTHNIKKKNKKKQQEGKENTVINENTVCYGKILYQPPQK